MRSKVLAAMMLVAVSAFAADTPKPPAPTAGKKWKATIPAVAENNETWHKLVPALLEKKMPYGAQAAAHNILNFFADLPSKELAFQTIISLVDQGWAISTRPYFIPADIEPNAATDFGKSYFFYKAQAEIDKNMNRWAQSQFEKVDKDNFPKYLFFQALKSYADGKLDDAAAGIKKALSITRPEGAGPLAAKEARTLARIYYEKEEFEKSLEIYNTFLLKLNPITPSDWLEAAWCLYRLKKYPEALGYTYNFESQAAGPTTQLEQYILRALIYREYCSVRNVAQLSLSFDKQYGKILDSIKLGEPLIPWPNVVKIELPETLEYRQAIRSLEELEHEKKNISALPASLRPLAEYLYNSEIAMMTRKKVSLENDALQVLAKHLIILGESLRFLRFDVIRGKFNPDAVFSDEKPPETVIVDSTDETHFRLHWRQWGDYWRDERMIYRGLLKNRCDN